MRISVCHIITKLELGGAQRNTLYTVAHLSRERFDPLLIAGTGGLLDGEATGEPGFRTVFVPALGRSIRPWHDLAAFVRLVMILRRERPRIVHTHSSKAGILGRWAAWCAGVPVIVHTVHGFGFNDHQRAVVRAVFVCVEALTACITDRLVAVTTEDVSKGLAHGIGTPQKYVIIRSGIDVEAFKRTAVDVAAVRHELGIASDAKIITTIGPCKPQKNLKDLVDCAALLLRQRNDVVFLVVGDGEQRPALEALCRSRGIEGRVLFLGWRKDTVRILAATSVFVMTSLWEGLPRSLLEAMCRAIPVVANAVDGVREIVRDAVTGYLVPPHDVHAAVRCITVLLDNASLARKMGEAGRDRIGQEFDISYMVRQQENMYADLVRDSVAEKHPPHG